jgi:mRNA deadenylase 3'-5' endonuclease subunit Ccr4
MQVVSYNVLADSYVKPVFYPHVDPGHLDPVWRRDALIARIASFRADAICLQEVESDLFAILESRLAGFVGQFARKAMGKPDGCATFVRGRVQSWQTLTYSDESGHVALLAVIEAQSRRLGIANTHLRWGPPDSQIGLVQANELLDAIGEAPWIIAGDFNAGPDSDLIEEFRRRGFRDGYASVGGATCNANGVAKRIDFLMYRGLRCVPERVQAIDGHTALPSATEPSDHLAIRAEFSWPEST